MITQSLFYTIALPGHCSDPYTNLMLATACSSLFRYMWPNDLGTMQSTKLHANEILAKFDIDTDIR